MSFVTKMKSSYPLEQDNWTIVFLLSLFISFFMLTFQPFGLNLVQGPYKTLILIGYGGVVFVTLFIILILCPRIFPFFFDEDKWTFARHIFINVLILVLVSIGNYLYTSKFLGSGFLNFITLFYFIAYTVVIGIFPIIMISFYVQNKELKTNLAIYTELNKAIDEKETPLMEVIDKQVVQEVSKITFGGLTVPINDLILIGSEGNYIRVWFKEENSIQNKMIRYTLKNAIIDLPAQQFLKCHRTFIVNLDFIENIHGNTNGCFLKMIKIDKEIPVSRRNVKVLREKMT